MHTNLYWHHDRHIVDQRSSIAMSHHACCGPHIYTVAGMPKWEMSDGHTAIRGYNLSNPATLAAMLEGFKACRWMCERYCIIYTVADRPRSSATRSMSIHFIILHSQQVSPSAGTQHTYAVARVQRIII
jgi:hypothetical protein